MKNKAPQSTVAILRQKAEALLKNKPHLVDASSIESETLKLIHELDVHQIELEMQNEELKIAKDQLEIAAEKYIDLYDFAPSGYFTLSKNGDILELNFRGANILGKERSHLINSRFAFFVADQSKVIFSSFLDKVFEEKTRQSCEITLSVNENRPTYLLLDGIASEDGEQCFITSVDITKRKIAEKDLLENEEKYRTLFDSNRDSITIFRFTPDGKPGHFIEANATTTELFGYTNKELMAMSIRDLESIPQKTRKKRIETLQANGRVDFETFLKTKKGKIRTVEIESLIINYLNEPAVMSITRDITERKQIENNIKKAQESLATILEAVPDLLFEVGLDGRIYHYQSHRDDLLAVPPSAFMGKLFQEVLPADVSSIILNAIQEASEKGYSNGHQYSLDLAKGKHWFELSVSKIKENDEKDQHFIVLARDITERKQGEISLREQEEKLRGIFKVANSGIVMIDALGNFVLFNDWCPETLGYTREEFRELNFSDVTYPGDLEQSELLINKLIEGKIDKYLIQKRCLTKDKSFIWCEVSASSIKDENNKVINIIVVINDITERKIAEKALSDSERFAKATFDALTAHIAILDENGFILSVNLAWRKFQESNTPNGAVMKSIEGTNYLNVCETSHGPYSEEASTMVAGIQSVMRGEQKEFTLEYPCHSPTEKRWFNARVTLFPINGNLRVVVTHENITQRKLAEEKLKLSEARLITAQAVAKVGSWETDLLYSKVIWSAENYNIFGLDPDATNPSLEEFIEIIHPDDRTLVETTFINSIKSNNINSLEHRIITPSGIEKIIEERWEILRDNHEQLLRAIGTSQDITERKKTEKIQKDSLDLIEKITSHVPGVVYQFKLRPDGTFCFPYASAGMKQIFDINPDEVIEDASKIFAGFHPDDIDYIYLSIGKSAKNLTHWKQEFRYIHRNGEIRYLLGNSIPQLEENGSVIWHGYISDITEQKQAEAKLIANENFLNQTQIIANLGSYSINFASGKWTSTTILDNIFGIDANYERTIEGWNSIIHPAWQTIMSNYLNNEVIEKKGDFNKEYKIIKINDKEERWVHGMGEITFDEEGQPLQLIGSIQDITKRKQIEESLRESEEKIRNLLDSTDGIIWEADAQTFNFTFVSKQAERLFGFPVEEWYTEGFWANHLHPEDKERTIEYCITQTKRMESHDFTYRFIANNGQVLWLRDIVKVIVADGKPLLLRGVMFDITKQKQVEHSLRESEEKYRGLVENSPDAVVIYIDGEIRFVNDEALHLVGANSRKEIIGKPVLQFIHPDSMESVTKKMAEMILDNNASPVVEEKFIHLNGTAIDVEIKGIPTIFEHKEAVQVIIHDITKRKQATLELNKINRVYSLISQINNLILRSKDREELFKEICRIAVTAGKFRMSWIGMIDDDKQTINTAAFYGFEDGYFSNYNGISILNEPRGKGPTGTAMREGRTIICNDIANDPMMEPWREAALQRGYRSSISIPIMVLDTIIGSFNLYSEETYSFSSEEEVALLEKITQNIAFTLESILFEEDRQRTQEKIQQLSQAVEQSPVTIIITNTNGKIEYVNPKFCETTGYTFEEVVGQNPRFLKSGHTSPKEYKELWQTLARGNEWHGEFHNIGKNGTFYWESASISPIINAQGKTTHYIAIKEDITDRKKVEKQLIKAKEQAEESDRLKLAFLANMSHEIRTPMNGILGFTELLKAPNLGGEEQQEYIRIIEKSGIRMLNIINDIISISKVESGQVEISLSETNVNEQIEYLYTFFKPEATHKGILLSITNELPSREAVITTDREKIYAILTNLVKNAIKFTDGGSIKFGYVKKGKYLEFFVKDTGFGISKSHMEIIFDRFRQANESLTRSHEGSGLGLAISKAYVEMLGGKIWVESEEGKGSSFYFTIPIGPKSKQKEAIFSGKQVAKEKMENKIKDLKILIVEDDSISKLLITIAVKPFSREILKVSTGFEAIEACRKNPDIDLVMMDINMPEMDGYEATKLIREFNKDLVIIAQTANGMQSDRHVALDSGCTDYISKPVNIASLSELIQKYFKK